MRENYHKAYLERLADKESLEHADRRVGTMHLGGVVIECLIKAMRVETDHVADWHIPNESCPACRALIRQGNLQKHGIKNPGHQLMLAIKDWHRLWHRLMSVPHRQDLINWITLLEDPSVHFIDLRYEHYQPNDGEFNQWCQAFNRFHGWLLQQNQQLKQGRR